MLTFTYRNYKGVEAKRRIGGIITLEFLTSVGFGYQPGWFLSGTDLDKEAAGADFPRRSFALSHIVFDPESPPEFNFFNPDELKPTSKSWTCELHNALTIEERRDPQITRWLMRGLVRNDLGQRFTDGYRVFTSPVKWARKLEPTSDGPTRVALVQTANTLYRVVWDETQVEGVLEAFYAANPEPKA